MGEDYLASYKFRYFVSVVNTPEGEVLIITDVVLGRSIKIKNPENYTFLHDLIESVWRHGFHYMGNKFYVAGVAYDTLRRLIKLPETEGGDKVYNAIMKFFEKGVIYLRE
jgi:hypothetical protein